LVRLSTATPAWHAAAHPHALDPDITLIYSLRMLRAIRFARLDFDIEPDTFDALT
jgi:hypothetical protein